MYLFQCSTKTILACAKCICRCGASLQGCPVLHTDQQPRRICKQGLRVAWLVTSAGTEMSGDLCLYLWGIRGRLGAVLAGHFVLRQLFLGGGLGVEQQRVDQEQRSTRVLPPAKLVFPNYKRWSLIAWVAFQPWFLRNHEIHLNYDIWEIYLYPLNANIRI